jgi:hypothetical protein
MEDKKSVFILMRARVFDYEPMFYTETFDELKTWVIEAWGLENDIDDIKNVYDLNEYFQEHDFEDKIMSVDKLNENG